MLILISPAKKLLPITVPYKGETSSPIFNAQSQQLIRLMKTKSRAEIAKLMHLSAELADLNYQRYQDFNVKNNPQYPAIFLFQGDVYRNLKAEKWDTETLNYAQSHLVILSGLYGLLRPLDVIQPYRLEMGTSLANSYGKNLYAFWKDQLTQKINMLLSTQENPLLINLASSEYFNAIHTDLLTAPLLTINFQEYKNDALQTIGIQAKKARGVMADFIIKNNLEDPHKIQAFKELQYTFCKKTSNEEIYNFIR